MDVLHGLTSKLYKAKTTDIQNIPQREGWSNALLLSLTYGYYIVKPASAPLQVLMRTINLSIPHSNLGLTMQPLNQQEKAHLK